MSNTLLNPIRVSKEMEPSMSRASCKVYLRMTIQEEWGLERIGLEQEGEGLGV